MAKRGISKCDKCKAFVPHLHPERLDEPTRWKKPRIVGVCFMNDLFGQGVEQEWQFAVLDQMRAAPQHVYLCLTKEPKSMLSVLWEYVNLQFTSLELASFATVPRVQRAIEELLPNLWVGVTITGKVDAWRLEELGRVPAAHRFVSYEPMLEAPPNQIVLQPSGILDYPDPKGVEWIIVGAQTGPGSKQPDPIWLQDVIAQARYAKVPIFIKRNVNYHHIFHNYPPELEALRP